jgi:hypothetical protein
MKKAETKEIQYLTSEQALDLCNGQGLHIKLGTIHLWYHKYHLGKKVAGRLRYDKEKLLKILEGR